MLRFISLAAAAVMLPFLFFSCDKNNNDEIMEGTYKGTFSATYKSGGDVQKGQTTIVLKDGTFSCTGNANRIPAGGSGTYKVSGSTITFDDANSWTADFNFDLVLDSSYSYSVDGRVLLIRKETASGIYQYSMEKE